MIGEVWGVKLTNGKMIPIYHIPYTQAGLYSLFRHGGEWYGDNLWEYTAAMGDYFPEPDLTFWRELLRHWQEGLNANNYLTEFPAGAASPMIDNVPQSSVVFTTSPGAITFESGPVLDVYRVTSTVSLRSPSGNSSSRWFNTGSGTHMSGKVTKVSPRIHEGLANTENSTSTEITPKIHCVTSDGVQVSIAFLINAASLGWQDIQVNTLGPGSWLGDYNPEWDQELITTFGEGEDPNMTRFDPTAVPNVGVYIVDQTDLLNLFADIWNRNFWEAFQQVFGGDPSSALLSIRYYYGLADVFSDYYSTTAGPVTIGNAVVGSDAGVSVPHLTNNIVSFSCGLVTVPRRFGDHRDYSQCAYRAWVPFVGWVDIDPNDILGVGQVCLTYSLNVATGEALAFLSTADNIFPNNFSSAFWSQQCSMGVDIPYAITSSQSLGSVAVSMMSFGAVSGSKFTPSESVYAGGSGASVGHAVVTDLAPKLVVYQKDDLTGDDHVDASGLPSADTASVGSLTGYAEIETAYNVSTALPIRRSGEIVQMLREGIYL